MSMVLYEEIAKNEEEKKQLIMKFDGFEPPILIGDSYCINSLCSCTSLLLIFCEIVNNEVRDKLFSLRLNIKTWKITNVSIKTKRAESKKIIAALKKGVDSSTKDVLFNRFKEAKEFSRRNPLKSMNPAVVTDGKCVPYMSIFGEAEVDRFCFEYKNVNYLVYDYYCMNPDCLCNEVLLAFIAILPDRKVQQAKFIIKLKLNDLSYEIERRKVSRKELGEIVQHFMNIKKDKIAEFKGRYKKMKKLGKEILHKNKRRK